MPAVQVREMPSDIYEDLKTCAREENRSIAQQTLVFVSQGLAARKVTRTQNAGVPTGASLLDNRADVSSSPLPQPFVPFEKDGVMYMTNPNETEEERHARLDKLMEGNKPFELPDGFPTAAELIRQDREDRTKRILNAVEG